MITYLESARLASTRLEEAGFFTKSLAHFPDSASRINLPWTRVALEGRDTAIPYVVMGDLDAEHVVLHATPYLTRLDPHFKLRLAAQQTALGEEYCVVGVGAYDPKGLGFDRQERKQISKGNFSPLATRMLRVAESLKLTDSQSVSPYGYSLGGDIAVQTAYDSHFDENKGIVQIEGLGAVEAARMRQRGAIAVSTAMANSSKKLFDNVLASDMPALLEAWNIDPEAGSEQAKKTMTKEVNKGAAGYWLSNVLSNVAITRGFGTDKSFEQLSRLITDTTLPIFIGRSHESQVFPKKEMDALRMFIRSSLREETVHFHVEDNDHSADDNLRKSAARILHFASVLFKR